jgi:uncharacterized protein (DUF58 family)
MTARAFLGTVLVLAGALLDVPIALGLGLVLVGFEVIRVVWVRRGLAGVGHRRTLAASRVAWGEMTGLVIEVWNRSRLPISWLRVDEAVSDDVIVRDRDLLAGDMGDLTLRNTWSLGPREIVRRRLEIGATRRGVYEVGPTSITAGDLFALPVADGIWPSVDRFVVWPRLVPAVATERRDRWGGADRARSGLSEDPSRFVGIRPYAAGDPVRRIHARSSARLGHPMTKRFEPSRDRDLLLVVDLEAPTSRFDNWDLDRDEPAEGLIVIAASIVRSLGERHAAFGIAAAGYSGATTRLAYLPVSHAPGQMERGLDLLARLSAEPSAPFERLAALIGRAVNEATTVVVLTGRDSRRLLRPLRALQRRGLTVRILAAGSAGPSSAARARTAGIPAEVIDLDGPWQTATQVMVQA